ncbi:molybdopterin-dependent oxidoreductase [Iamia majanohamensis]|uniref:Molybdopterin-dependent oxidoreductase n=1 Tax=Iamia majanohamensis TaxID=467976 RepID=A0AAE9Y8P2_9ACTN|nr:molybdopterin cofactor-binding domain-containing protein [Iamia majanohamensis]WCO66528.1 molybdopterin-dependent oxidoreductase [Iamia majanohamensis]
MTATEPRTDEATKVTGTRLLRKEDPALLTGEGRYTDDLQIPGALHMSVVRSPFAHARITSIDTADALASPGVVAVYTGADLADLWADQMPMAWQVTEDMHNPPHFPVTQDTARYVGDAVAVVLAESSVAARDAVDLVDVDYDPLPAVVDLEAALTDEVVIHESAGTNKAYTWDLEIDEAAVAKAFDEAAHTVTGHFVQQRLLPMPMEPRAVACVPEPFGGGLTLYSATQIPHILKVMTAVTLGMSEADIRVVAPSVGGGFGSKLEVYAEEMLCTALAHKLRRPVRWLEERSENAQATIHGRGQIQEIDLAADADGKVTGVRVRLLADMGAYLQLITPGIPLLGSFLYCGVYDIPAFSFTCTGVFTTMTPTDAYRGAGRPEATYAIERGMDLLAREVGVDPAEIRRRNYITHDQFPYTAVTGLEYDSGNHESAAQIALDMAGYDDLRAEQAKRREEGGTRHLGIGMSSYFEMCGLAPSRVLASLNYSAGGWESATVRMMPTGKVQVVSGATPHGQGHETSWSMIVADKLGVSPDDVEVLHSDTNTSPHGMDTYGSRSLPVGGVAVALACDQVIDKAKQIAAHQMEASADDLELSGGVFTVRGSPDKEMPMAAVAFEAFTAHDLPDGVEPNLTAQVTYDPPNFSWPFGTHVCAVEVDEETGAVEVRDYVAVDDCGTQINPMIVEGQVHGGIVQGLAQALFEEAVYDADGNLQAGSLAEYLVPAAPDVPPMRLGHSVTPSPTNSLGVKGVGEAGTIGAASTVINAVVDALSHKGVTEMRMPASPLHVWEALQAARGGDGEGLTAEGATDTAGADRDAPSDSLQADQGGAS